MKFNNRYQYKKSKRSIKCLNLMIPIPTVIIFKLPVIDHHIFLTEGWNSKFIIYKNYTTFQKNINS